jgi:hypothetical protein
MHATHTAQESAMDDQNLYRMPISEPPDCEIIYDDFAELWRRSEEHYQRMLNDCEYRDAFNAATKRWMQAKF